MQRLWSVIVGVLAGLLAVCFGFVSAAMLLGTQDSAPKLSTRIGGYAFGLLGLVCLFVAYRRLRRSPSIQPPNSRSRDADDASLERWQLAESRPVQRPRDPRTKFCLENVGNEILIRYRGRELRITPVSVYSKATFRRTYVDAISQGEKRTYNIDEIELL